ncbi:hypothetical protein AAAC51_07865 [Priestia megaterium]
MPGIKKDVFEEAQEEVAPVVNIGSEIDEDDPALADEEIFKGDQLITT